MFEAWFLPVAGFFGGALLGLASQAGRFCTHGAIEDVVLGGDSRRLRMAFLGLALAMAALFALSGIGLVSLETAPLLARPLPLLSVAIGSLLFGIGMALVGTCAFGALARTGSGDLGGMFVAGVVGVTGYSMASGFLRGWMDPLLLTPPPTENAAGIAHAVAAQTGLPTALVGMAIAGALAAYVLSDRDFRSEKQFIAWGVVLAIAITSGWLATGIEAQSGFAEVVAGSHSFVRPLGDTVITFMTGPTGQSGFGIGAVLGVVAGGAMGAALRGTFNWQACDDARTFKRQFFGAVLMGIGGILAFGCTIGQGFTAASALAWSAPVAMTGMFIGSWYTLQWMVHGSIIAPLKELFRLA